jgi:hypothetical protein
MEKTATMTPVSHQATPLIIAGMHRSGTSLAAALLQSSGLDVGKRLMGAGEFNPKGHFENLDFVEFHRSVLESLGLHEAGWTLQNHLELTYAQVQQAQAIVAQNQVAPVWGWKDPRTTLFLDFWARLLPDAKFLLLYRAPWEVVDSLLRRSPVDEDIFLARPDFAIQLWLHYNRKILEFCAAFPERTLLVNVTAFTNNLEAVVAKINQHFGLSLTTPANDIYDPSLLHGDLTRQQKVQLIHHYVPEAIALYRDLIQKEAALLGYEADLGWLSTMELSSGYDWAFQDWLTTWKSAHERKKLAQELVTLKQQNDELETNLAQLQAHSATLSAEKSHLESQYTQLVTEKNEIKDELVNLKTHNEQLIAAQIHLVQAQQQATAALVQVQAQLEDAHSRLEDAHSRLEDAHLQLAAMASSKFWQMRQAWFRLKKVFGVG